MAIEKINLEYDELYYRLYLFEYVLFRVPFPLGKWLFAHGYAMQQFIGIKGKHEMIKRKEGENIVIYPWWKGGTEDYIPSDSPKLIISPPSERVVTGIKIVGFDGGDFNIQAVKELSEGMTLAISLAIEMEK